MKQFCSTLYLNHEYAYFIYTMLIILFNVEPELPDYRPATVTRISIPVTMTTKMAPKSKIIVYYIHRDGEVVSGHGQFTVANVFENKVIK